MDRLFAQGSPVVVMAAELLRRHVPANGTGLCRHCQEPAPCPTAAHARLVQLAGGLTPPER